MEPNPHVISTPRYAALVVPDYKRDEKRLVFAAPTESCRFNPTKLPFFKDSTHARAAHGTHTHTHSVAETTHTIV